MGEKGEGSGKEVRRSVDVFLISEEGEKSKETEKVVVIEDKKVVLENLRSRGRRQKGREK